MDKRQMDTALWMGELEAILQMGKDVPLNITGNSMAPFLRHDRDQVLLRTCTAPIRRGDILLYKRPNGQYILHRVVKVKRDHLWMAGDAQHILEQVSPDWVIARAVKARRNGKWLTPKSPVWQFYRHLWRLTLPFRNTLRQLHIRLHK